tara:strand:- start:817 stop:1089 length:273 start_codon:yes stop_codon:yes gene_type:complete
MFKKIKNVFFLTSALAFVFLITKYYFSEGNIIFISKSRSSYSTSLNIGSNNLPILSNDTDDIIIYKNDLDEFKSKRKKRFWEKLISNENE